MRTTSPSSASVIVIWQDSREFGSFDRGKAQHALFHRIRLGQADAVEPGGVDVDMAGGAGALAAAIGVDPGHPVVDGAAHDRQPDRHLDLMRRPVMFDVGDFRHPSSPIGGGPVPAKAGTHGWRGISA